MALETMWRARLFRLVMRALVRLNRLPRAMGLYHFRAFQGLKYGVRRLMLRSLGSSQLLLIDFDGHPMFIFNTPYFTESYLVRSYEPYTIELFKAAIKPGATVLDIGAHIGVFTLLASRQAGAAGKVYAFEPAPENFRLLDHNARKFGAGNVVAVQKAVGEGKKTVSLLLAEGPDMNSLYPHPLCSMVGSVPVECVSIDEFLRGGPVDVIKMDIEGHEPYALMGMKQTIATSGPLTLFVELNPACLRRAGVEAEDFLASLVRLGFRVQLIDEHSRSLKRVTASLMQDAKNVPSWYANLCCIKEMPEAGSLG